MIQKLKRNLLALAALLVVAVPVAVPAAAFAGSNGCKTDISGNVAQGASQAATGSDNNVTCNATNADGSGLTKIANNIVNIFSIIVGAVAIIMIIYGGFRYITSGGDSGSVGNAKNTLIYAIVGLIIVVIAQLIVHVVLAQTNNVIQ